MDSTLENGWLTQMPGSDCAWPVSSEEFIPLLVRLNPAYGSLSSSCQLLGSTAARPMSYLHFAGSWRTLGSHGVTACGAPNLSPNAVLSRTNSIVSQSLESSKLVRQFCRSHLCRSKQGDKGVGFKRTGTQVSSFQEGGHAPSNPGIRPQAGKQLSFLSRNPQSHHTYPAQAATENGRHMKSIALSTQASSNTYTESHGFGFSA